ncbi:copper resistance CopC family protein [Micromonospora sp. SL1-18]|uniref:copper resistance CopC family protein n=1 Tax=Micromonospora sp. SL1-18 TaxID=3399128 RepID=UPI003A4E1481
MSTAPITRVPSRRLRRVGAVLVTLLAAAVVVLGYLVSTTPVRLVSSAPGSGASLAAPPRSVSLTFSRPLDAGDSHISVGTATGKPVVSGGKTVDGRTVTQPVAITAGGSYLVVYHVTFGDGREMSGTLRFNVAGTGTDAAAAPGRSDTAGPVAGGQQGRITGGHEHGTFDPVTLAIVGADAVVVLGVVVLMWRRRRRRARLP